MYCSSNHNNNNDNNADAQLVSCSPSLREIREGDARELEAQLVRTKVGDETQSGQHHSEPTSGELLEGRYVNVDPFDDDQGNFVMEELQERDAEEELTVDQMSENGPTKRGAETRANCKEHNIRRDADSPKPQPQPQPQPTESYGLQGGDSSQEFRQQQQQLLLLRDLLNIERCNNERHLKNNQALKGYVQQLQTDYLRQQSDLVQVLEFCHKLKGQKEAQLETVEATVRERETQLEQLRTRLAQLDESRLNAEFKAAMEKQKQLAELEQAQLRAQIASNEQQLTRERVSNSQLLQQFQERLDNQCALHERELAHSRGQLERVSSELERVLAQPQNLLVKALREDKSQLEIKCEESSSLLIELEKKYDSLKRRLEFLAQENEDSELRDRNEIERLQELQANQRDKLGQLRMELDEKQEVVQVLQFNLQRSEKRVKSLLGLLKNKEMAYKELVAQSELRHQRELDKLKEEAQLVERRLIGNEDDLGRKRNELLRVQIENENQLESMRNDRDERLKGLVNEKQSLIKELRGTELRLARELEQSSERAKLVEQLQREARQFREESRRLSLELTQSEAKLYAKQQELNKSLENLTQSRAETLGRELNESRLEQLSSELNEERQLSRRLRSNIEELKKGNEKLTLKLRIAETNLDKISVAINREHTKMMREYERRLEQVRSEQAVFDRSRLRYRRYSNKLKKYCEHLRLVHEHLCDPAICGYIMGPLRAAAATSMSPMSDDKRRLGQQAPIRTHLDKASLFSNDELNSEDGQFTDALSEEEEKGVEVSSSVQQGQNGERRSLNRISLGHQHHHYYYCPSQAQDRFIVKRTGIRRTPSTINGKISRRSLASSSTKSLHGNRQTASAPLRAKDLNSFQPPEGVCGGTVCNKEEHDYYYINENHSFMANKCNKEYGTIGSTSGPEPIQAESSGFERPKKPGGRRQAVVR